jgi:hypothetical protein
VEQAAADIGGDPEELITGYFRDIGLLGANTAQALKAPDRRYPPLSPEYDGRLFGWLVDQLVLARPSAPERAWPVILELIRRAPDTDALGFVGADALEDLVNGHGREFESRILDRASRDPRFRVALANVWSQDGVPDSLVQAIDALRKGSDQKPG